MSDEGLESRLALVDGVLDGAYFSPLHQNDWLAFCLGEPALMGLEDEEAFDLFARAAIVAETVYPELAEGRAPLAWLWAAPDPRPVLAHALASLKDDRPYLFHRVLWSLPAVSENRVDPDQHEVMEDFIAAALDGDQGLRESMAEELETVRRRGLGAAGQDPDAPDPRLADLARQALADAPAESLVSDVQLRMWMALGGGLDFAPENLRPAVMVEAWSAWVGAVTGAEPDLELLGRLLPRLTMDAQELALYAPPDPHAGHVISAACPFCRKINRLRLGQKVKDLARCPHLVYMGSDDELHLWQVVQNFKLGRDFVELMDSYLQSRADLELFATIVNDLYEMLTHQGRLEARPVECESAPRAFHYLRAYFAGKPPDSASRH
ncbi:MAG: hypothetical protein ACOZHQ_08605 [Thermodesulfobacteriota bacterium]